MAAVCMTTCERTENCPFFTTEVGFSPALNDAMKERYCLGEHAQCARRQAAQALGGFDMVPPDMLPSDFDRLAQLTE
jgi:hypothetical protein